MEVTPEHNAATKAPTPPMAAYDTVDVLHCGLIVLDGPAAVWQVGREEQGIRRLDVGRPVCRPQAWIVVRAPLRTQMAVPLSTSPNTSLELEPTCNMEPRQE